MDLVNRPVCEDIVCPNSEAGKAEIMPIRGKFAAVQNYLKLKSMTLRALTVLSIRLCALYHST